MPTYDYECRKCKHLFEVFQSMTAKPLAKCPKCKTAAKRLISSGAGIIFKGSGFYATDYKKSKEKPCGKADTSCPSSCKHNHK